MEEKIIRPNFGDHLPVYTASYPRRFGCSKTFLIYQKIIQLIFNVYIQQIMDVAYSAFRRNIQKIVVIRY